MFPLRASYARVADATCCKLQVQLLKDRYDESVGQKNALMEESQMLQVGKVFSFFSLLLQTGQSGIVVVDLRPRSEAPLSMEPRA